MTNRRRKVCYVLPEYRKDASSHYYHLYELLEAVGKELDVRLFVEYAEEKPKLANVGEVRIQRFRFLPLRIMERFAVFTMMRMRGCRRFYVHQARGSAILASLVTRLSGGKTYFWYCGGMVEEEGKLTMFDACLRAVDYLVTGNKTMAEYYSKTFGISLDKIKIMPNWVNLQRFDPARYDRNEIRKRLNIGEDKKVVLFVHWLSEIRGAHHIRNIIENVSKAVPDAVFVIVGAGPYKPKLEEEIKESGLAEAVRIVGKVPNLNIPEYYATADVFIMPSIIEGFPRVLLEAMAMGVPFVATDAGGVRDIITKKQAEYVTSVKDLDRFHEKVADLLKKEKTRAELRADGLEKVREYSKENVAKRFIELME